MCSSNVSSNVNDYGSLWHAARLATLLPLPRLLLTLANEIENENMSGFKNIIVLNLQQICFSSQPLLLLLFAGENIAAYHFAVAFCRLPFSICCFPFTLLFSCLLILLLLLLLLFSCCFASFLWHNSTFVA